jgi:purine nucleosidase
MNALKNGRCWAIIPSLALFALLTSEFARGDEYRQRRQAIQARRASDRKVPVIPPKDQRIRCIIDTDAKNEIDDVWAIGLALCCQDRFQIEGFVAANYDNTVEDAGPNSLEGSVAVLQTLLDKAGLEGEIPIYRGSHPLRYQFEPSESEGVDFIIERAMASSPDDPLWVIGLGAATNIASAYLKRPEIADRIVVFWHFRTRWPDKCWNFNVIGDIRAARIVFHSDLSFVLFDTGTHLVCPMDESVQYREYGELGKYLHDYRLKSSGYQSPKKGFFDLGDIAALIDPDLASWEVVKCPDVDWDLTYRFNNTQGSILRCKDIDRDKTFALLKEKLQQPKWRP